MYICVCNCLKEQDCRNALEEGASSALEVYAKQGCAPKCGRCVPFMEQTFFGQVQAGMPSHSNLSF